MTQFHCYAIIKMKGWPKGVSEGVIKEQKARKKFWESIGIEGRRTVLSRVSLLPAEATTVRDAPSLALAYCPLSSPGGAGTTCGHSCSSPVSSWEDQVSLQQETRGEGTSWVPSPRSQTFLFQGAKLPFTTTPRVPVVWGGKPSISSLLPFFPCSAETGQDLIQPCWRLRELRPCCQSLYCCGLTDQLAAGIHELNRGLCHHSLNQLLSLKVAPQVAFSFLKHQLRWPQNHVKCLYYPGNWHLLPAVSVLSGPVGTAWVTTKSKLSPSVSCQH